LKVAVGDGDDCKEAEEGGIGALKCEDICKCAVDSPTKPGSLSLAIIASCSMLEVKKG
jgi:hypothetical protein